MSGINILRRLLMKEAVKDTANMGSGIMTINRSLRSLVDKDVDNFIMSAQKQGVDLNKLGEQELKYMLEMNKPKPPKVIAADSPEGKGITQALFGKRGKVVDFPQKKNFKQEVDDMIKDGTINKRLKTEAQLKAEIEASNKKAVKNLGNKRQLTEDEYQDFLDEVGGADQLEAYNFDGTVGDAKRIVKEQKNYMSQMEMEFRKGKLDPEPYSGTPQRKRFLQNKLDEAEASGDARIMSREEREELFDLDNIEDFAEGGVAGMLGERTGYRRGGRRGNTGQASQGASKSSSQGPAGGASAGGNYGGNKNPSQTYGGSIFSGGGGGGNQNTGGGGPPSINTGGGSSGGTTPTTTTTQPTVREIMRQKQVLNYLNSLEEEELPSSFGRGKIFGQVFKSIKPKVGPKELGIEYFKNNPFGNSLKLNLDTKVKDLLKGKVEPKLKLEGNKGNLKYGFDIDTDKNINFGIKMPFGGQRKRDPKNLNRFAPDISKFNLKDMIGIKSQAPANMQMAMITDTQKDLIDKQGKIGQLTGAFDADATFNAAKTFDDTGSSGVFGIGARPAEPMTREEFDAYVDEQGYANGGPARQNFAMGRRAFLKMLAGTGAGIAGLKTGITGLGGKKVATEVAKDVATTSGGTVPPYFFNLVKKIKNLGDEAAPSQDKAVAYKYKTKDGGEYNLEEDFAGNIEIKKTSGDEYYPEDVYMSYKVDDVPTKKGGSKKVEEYEEFTAKPDMDGKMKDVEGGVPDSVVQEGTMFEDDITDFATKKVRTKKAGGGVAYMLGQ